MSGGDDLLRAWHERDPDRLRWELANFADAGLSAFQRITAGGLAIDTVVEISDGQRIGVQVCFPTEYPIADPKVVVSAGLLGPPHESGGVLCVLDNPGAQWHPGRGAVELVVRAGQLIDDVLVGGPDALAKREELVPVRAGAQVGHTPGVVILVTDPFFDSPPDGLVVGWFRVTTNEHGTFLLSKADGWGEADARLATRVGCLRPGGDGVWVASESMPLTVAELGTMLRDDPVLAEAMRDKVPWIAITYPEEGALQGDPGRGWSFVRNSVNGPELVEMQAFTREQRMLRVPELVGLETCRFVMVGAGSLGGTVALDLARAGAGELVIIDSDRYDINNAVRHELPASAAGMGKAVGVATLCEAANPFCDVRYDPRKLGETASPPVAVELLSGATLVIETTGSAMVTRIVERYCGALEIPLLTASLTAGARGAEVLLLTPELCFECFLDAQDSGEIEKPAVGESSLAVPLGCASPTFSGAGFDAAELAAVVARTAVRAAGRTPYPELDYNWAAINFVQKPRWTQGLIEPNPDCPHRR